VRPVSSGFNREVQVVCSTKEDQAEKIDISIKADDEDDEVDDD